MKQILSFTLNGEQVDLVVKPTETLLDVLRERLNFTGMKRGCDDGDCGTCTVLINGEPVRSCLTLALTAAGKDVVTIEGVAKDGKLHPIQKAFMDNGAVQCGFCTPAMVLVAKALLDKNPHPTRHDVVYYMSGNLCRCGCYDEIVDAVLAVANGKVKEA